MNSPNAPQLDEVTEQIEDFVRRAEALVAEASTVVTQLDIQAKWPLYLMLAETTVRGFEREIGG